jgi:hypothetical protein
MIKLNKKYIGKTGFLFIAMISVFVTGALLAGEETPVTISSAVDKSRIRIGDVITYTVAVSYTKNVKVKAPGAGENLGAKSGLKVILDLVIFLGVRNELKHFKIACAGFRSMSLT